MEEMIEDLSSGSVSDDNLRYIAEIYWKEEPVMTMAKRTLSNDKLCHLMRISYDCAKRRLDLKENIIQTCTEGLEVRKQRLENVEKELAELNKERVELIDMINIFHHTRTLCESKIARLKSLLSTYSIYLV